MGYHVYRYMHPDYPWLYVGKSDVDCRNRIYDHENSENDNIDRKYLKLLKESVVYYIELKNKAETKIVETYLINKHKPFLNKSNKYETLTDSLMLKMPKWQRLIRKSDIEYSIEHDKHNIELLKKESNELKNEIKVIQNEIAEERLKIRLQTIEKETYINKAKFHDCEFKFSIDEVKDFLENTDIDCEFCAELYDGSKDFVHSVVIRRVDMKITVYVNGDVYPVDIWQELYFSFLTLYHNFIPTNKVVFSLYYEILCNRHQKYKPRTLIDFINENISEICLESVDRDPYNCKVWIKNGNIIRLMCEDMGEFAIAADIKWREKQIGTSEYLSVYDKVKNIMFIDSAFSSHSYKKNSARMKRMKDVA